MEAPLRNYAMLVCHICASVMGPYGDICMQNFTRLWNIYLTCFPARLQYWRDNVGLESQSELARVSRSRSETRTNLASLKMITLFVYSLHVVHDLVEGTEYFRPQRALK
jgi:hypothetical protein